MVKKTQKESEQPAKVYQLDAVETKVDQVLSELGIIKSQTIGVVSQHQLETAKKEMKEYTDKEIGDAKSEINNEYRPMKKAINKFVWLVVAGVVGIAFQAYIIYVISRG